MSRGPSFYRRPLPDSLVAFSSREGREVFRQALLSGTMEGYPPLAEQFHTQAEPTFCGLGSLVIVLNALSIDPGRLWRGPWRWYGEELLDCCRPLEVIRKEGLTLDDFACLARCNGASTTVHRADVTSLDQFREHLHEVATTPEGLHMVVAYDRAVLSQTGAGHYSPIGGYHRGRDLALVLDVARFKYPPYWVSAEALYASMQTVDEATSKARGYTLLRRSQGATLWAISCRDTPFAAVLARLREHLPQAMGAGAASQSDAMTALLLALPQEVIALLDPFVDSLGSAAEPQHRALLSQMIQSLRKTKTYALMERAILNGRPDLIPLQRRTAPAERATLLLFVLADEILAALAEPARSQIAQALAEDQPILFGEESLAQELGALRRQVAELTKSCCPAKAQ